MAAKLNNKYKWLKLILFILLIILSYFITQSISENFPDLRVGELPNITYLIPNTTYERNMRENILKEYPDFANESTFLSFPHTSEIYKNEEDIPDRIIQDPSLKEQLTGISCRTLEWKWLLKDTQINEGDPIQYTIEYKFNCPYYFIRYSYDNERYYKVSKPNNIKLPLEYYVPNNNKFYLKECYDMSIRFNKSSSVNSCNGEIYEVKISRPSFINNPLIQGVLFITIFVLLFSIIEPLKFFFKDFLPKKIK